MNQYNAWTKERDEQLTKWRAEGFSAAQIAVKLGSPHVTRSAVMGRAMRLGLARKQSTKSVPKQAISVPKRTLPFKHLPPLPSQRTASIAIDQQADAPVAPVALFDLEPHHCRWPVSDAPYMFCAGTKQDGSSYCQRHFG